MARTEGSGRKAVWKTALTDSPSTDTEGRGTIRVEAGALGERKFVWCKVVQPGGATLGDVLQYALTWGGLTVSVMGGSGMTDAGSASVGYASASGVDAADNEFVDDYVIYTSTLVGVAPEGEARKITSNTSSRFNVSPDFSASTIAKDAFVIMRPYVVVDAVSQPLTTTDAINPFYSKVAGVAMADAGDGDYLWLQTHGINLQTKVDTAAATINAPAIVGPSAAEVSTGLTADALSLQNRPVREIGFFITSVHADLEAGDTTNLTTAVYLEIS